MLVLGTFARRAVAAVQVRRIAALAAAGVHRAVRERLAIDVATDAAVVRVGARVAAVVVAGVVGWALQRTGAFGLGFIARAVAVAGARRAARRRRLCHRSS